MLSRRTVCPPDAGEARMIGLSPQARGRVLYHVAQLHDGTELRRVALAETIGADGVPLAPGDPVRLDGDSMHFAKRRGIGVYLGAWWGRA